MKLEKNNNYDFEIVNKFRIASKIKTKDNLEIWIANTGFSSSGSLNDEGKNEVNRVRQLLIDENRKWLQIRKEKFSNAL